MGRSASRVVPAVGLVLVLAAACGGGDAEPGATAGNGPVPAVATGDPATTAPVTTAGNAAGNAAGDASTTAGTGVAAPVPAATVGAPGAAPAAPDAAAAPTGAPTSAPDPVAEAAPEEATAEGPPEAPSTDPPPPPPASSPPAPTAAPPAPPAPAPTAPAATAPVHTPGSGPSALARMVCEEDEIHDAVELYTGESLLAPPQPTFAGGLSTCPYVLPHGTVTLSVQELTDRAATDRYYADLAARLGNAGRVFLGEDGFQTPAGSVVVRKDDLVLLVDTTAFADLPAPRSRSQVANNLAAVVMACWT